MKISVVIPFYSKIDWLEEAVMSVLSQTRKADEIIVVNDGSKESDEFFLLKFHKVVKYFKIKNNGPAYARNFGISQAKGKYIAFLDSDDLWDSRKLEVQIGFMEKNNSSWSHTNYSTFSNETLEKLESFNLEQFSGKIFPQCLARNHIATPSVVVRRDLLVGKFLFQEKMRFGQDYYLWLLLSKDHQLDLITDELLNVRIRGTNAAVRARAHIQVRGQIWDLLKNEPVFKNVKFKPVFKVVYSLCSYENRLLASLEPYLSNLAIERLSKILFVVPYFSFKGLFTILKKTS